MNKGYIMHWLIKRDGNIVQQIVTNCTSDATSTNVITATTEQMKFVSEAAAIEVANIWDNTEVVQAA
jgi:hypothetical protein